MEYLFSKTIESKNFDKVVNRTIEVLQRNHFGILSDIDVSGTLKKKLKVEMGEYRILGACNPPFAHQVLLLDLNIGAFLPCNLIVYRLDSEKIVVGATDPTAAMLAVKNAALDDIALNVKGLLKKVIDEI